MSKRGWIGVDLDGTLARHGQWRGADYIGPPIPAMVDRVKKWLREGETVKIFTARVSGHGLKDKTGKIVDALGPIYEWCEKHIGQVLDVTNVKDFDMIALYDDRAVQVETNTGRLIE